MSIPYLVIRTLPYSTLRVFVFVVVDPQGCFFCLPPGRRTGEKRRGADAVECEPVGVPTASNRFLSPPRRSFVPRGFLAVRCGVEGGWPVS
jgi:hypothetical protein